MKGNLFPKGKVDTGKRIKYTKYLKTYSPEPKRSDLQESFMIQCKFKCVPIMVPGAWMVQKLRKHS
jgi:hypothetical protein